MCNTGECTHDCDLSALDGFKEFFNNTELVCDSLNNCAFVCPNGQVWYNAASDSYHSGIFTCDINQSDDWQHDPIDRNFVCMDFETACGNIESTFTLTDGATVDCLEVNDVGTCIFSCPDDKLSYPLTGVSCNAQTGQWNEAAATISCKDTRCGDTADWNFGSDWGDVEANCDYSHIDDRSTCNLDCSSGFPYPVDIIACNSAGETVPEQDQEIYCADTPCGNLDDFFNVNMNGMQQSCDENGCELSCSNPNKIPSVRNIACVGTQFQFADGLDGSTTIQCVARQDTPCGNLFDSFDFENTILVQCDEFNSITQNGAVSCSFMCDPTMTDVGDAVVPENQIVCENGEYNIDPANAEEFVCADQTTVCGGPEDNFVVTNSTGVSFDCVGNNCAVICNDASLPRPNVAAVTCNPFTQEFRDVTIFSGTDFPVVNPDIECRAKEDTYCGNPEDTVPHNASAVAFDCDYDTGKCQVVCGGGETSYATVEEVVCNAQTESFLPVDEPIDCLSFDSVCGDIDDHFDLDDGIQFTCTQLNIFDVCTLTCSDDLIPSPTDKIECNRQSELYIDAGLTISCIEPPETDCGYLADNFNIANNVTADCDEVTGICTFSCPLVTDYIELKSTQCINGQYSSRGATVECLVKDTACGDFIHPHTSSKNCADNTCTFTCAEGFVSGITTATCDDGEWVYEYHLPSDQESAEFSNCLDTMCGTLTGDVVNIDESVTVDMSDLDDNMGFGAITLTCAEDGKVISGLNGESEIGCNANTGDFDVANQGATVSCADTVCGDPEDVVEISDNTNADCSGSVCNFSCDDEDANPSLEALVCDVATSKFLVGSVTRVSCNANCAPFGPDSGFMLDNELKVICNPSDANPLLDTCDLICLNRAQAQVKETKENLDQVQCVYDEDTGVAEWQHVIHNVFGVPTTKEIQSAGNRTEMALRNVICDVEAEPTPPPKETQCGGVRDMHKIDDEVNVRCSWEICSLQCPKGKVVNTEFDWLYCVKNYQKLEPFWFPPVDTTIKCIDEGSSKDQDNKAKVCENPRNSMEKGVKKNCSGGNNQPAMCEFTCKDGEPNVALMTCSLDGEWNVHESIDIVCLNKEEPTTTESTTTFTTTSGTTTASTTTEAQTTEEQTTEEQTTPAAQETTSTAAGIIADGGKKKKKKNKDKEESECDCDNLEGASKSCLKQCKKQKQKEENDSNDGKETSCDCDAAEITGKCVKICKKLNKKDKGGKKDKEGKKDKKDKEGKKDKKKKKEKEDKDDQDNVDPTKGPTTTTPKPTKTPKPPKPTKGPKETKKPKDKKDKNKNGEKELADAESVGDEAQCDPLELSKQFGAGLDIDCDFGFKEHG